MLGFTAENILRLAVVVAELESRGEDLSGLKIGLLPILRDIAAGKLLPDLVVLYAGQPALLKRAGKLAVEEQRRVVSGEQRPPALPLRIPRAYKAPPEPERTRPVARFAAESDDEPGVASVAFNPADIASKGQPRDVGEMAAELILNCSDPEAAYARVVERLEAAKLIGSHGATIVSGLPELDSPGGDDDGLLTTDDRIIARDLAQTLGKHGPLMMTELSAKAGYDPDVVREVFAVTGRGTLSGWFEDNDHGEWRLTATGRREFVRPVHAEPSP